MKQEKQCPKEAAGRRCDRRWNMAEITEEFRITHDELCALGPAVSIFGSARFQEDNPYYQMAMTIAERLSQDGFNIVSGGGPGIMEAANRGAQKGKGKSVGLNIKLPREQTPNPYQDIVLHYNNFFSRKTAFIEHSEAFICMPGGFGTLDELAEVLTLIQTKKIAPMPFIMVGKRFWSPLIAWFREELLEEEGAISPEDLELFDLVDSVEEAIECFYQYFKKPEDQ